MTKNTVATIILLAIAVLVLAIMGLVWVATSHQNPQSTPAAQQAQASSAGQIAGWQTYKNDQYGFGFMIPNALFSDYQVKTPYFKQTTNGVFFGLPNVLSVAITNEYQDKNFQQMVNAHLKNQSATAVKQENIILGGKQGIRIDYQILNGGNPIGLHQTEVYVPLQNNYLFIGIDDDHFTYSGGANPNDFLNTFTFTK